MFHNVSNQIIQPCRPHRSYGGYPGKLGALAPMPAVYQKQPCTKPHLAERPILPMKSCHRKGVVGHIFSYLEPLERNTRTCRDPWCRSCMIRMTILRAWSNLGRAYELQLVTVYSIESKVSTHSLAVSWAPLENFSADSSHPTFCRACVKFSIVCASLRDV